jgi:hypothetical protein
MRSSFPEFYEWVVNSGLTVALGSYALVEGSCGYYGLDTNTGTVRMPTLAAGVFGTTTAGQYGQAVQAGLPNITGTIGTFIGGATGVFGAGTTVGSISLAAGSAVTLTHYNKTFGAHTVNSVYGRSDTVTPSHVQYPWVIVVYNAAVPPSVAQAGEFIDLLDGKENKGAVRTLNGVAADAAGDVKDFQYWVNDENDEFCIRFTNGLQVCWGTTGNNSSYTVTFLKPFKYTPAVFGSIYSITPSGKHISVTDVSTTKVTIVKASATGGYWFAIHRWN